MNKIDAFFVMVSLLLIWIFAIFLFPYKVMMFIYPAISAWAFGIFIGNVPRKLAKETDRDYLDGAFKMIDEQHKEMVDMLFWMKEAAAYSRSLEARIDELMFEYCPEDMTEAQIAHYEAHVRASKEQDEVERALRH